ncbi:MAG TPA: hypothetical protein PKY77_11305 [Phycisphaerae bacterium]|nr:hypothetical protein [Phycisphaerae bacterium]HRY70308.1 hypothetical protein [Phycisphaerae bacterium]HSA28025.1 hypothetical protein [Phycisphaerae bacterium]
MLAVLTIILAALTPHAYTYDSVGNRSSVRRAESDGYQSPRSYLYVYDALQRLIEAQKGPTLDENDIPVYSGTASGYSFWSLDLLGNWAGSDPANWTNTLTFGGREEWSSGLTTRLSKITHLTDQSNQITGVGTGNGPQPVYYLNDAAGNLVLDGTYVYQYDAWNRLVQVNLVGTLVYDPTNPDTDDFNAAGQIAPVQGHAIGSVVAWNTYDALGRLVAAGEQTTDGLKTVHYYYDGVRRIQEVVDPSSPTGTGTTRGEYVYGPDYVDEFVLQSYSLGSGQGDRQAKMYMLQDANYNVMALVDATGGVLEQYQWDPYGTLVSKQTTASPAPVRILTGAQEASTSTRSPSGKQLRPAEP